MNIYTSEKRTNDTHVTIMFCYYIIGKKMKLFIILLYIPFLPFAFESVFSTYFASHQNCWMTRTLFGSFTVYFVRELTHIRQIIAKNCIEKILVI